MAKFIKFTNVTPLDLLGRKVQTIDEIIFSTEQISSLSKTDDTYFLGTKSTIIDCEGGSQIKSFAPTTQNAIISKEDYENAKKILLEV